MTTDIYGGVQSRTPAQDKVETGENYFSIAKSDIPIWEKILQLSQYYKWGKNENL